MAQLDDFKKGMIKVVVFALLSLFLIPLVTLGFVAYAEAQIDKEFLAAMTQPVNSAAPQFVGSDASREFFQKYPPSVACGTTRADLAEYRALVCPPYSQLWQFSLAEQVSKWTLLAGVIVLLLISALGVIAFLNRTAQYVSFVIGWNALRVTSALEVIVQGVLLVWLSFWVTAYFWHRYIPKLILIIGVLVGGMVFYAVVGIFRRPPRDSGINGELIRKEDAPALWDHIEDRAKQLQTAPPDYIVAGIDTNFFVTESPLQVRQQTLKGRSLFVSLPLLRILDRAEADAVLAHELAHFSGGDTANSAALGPKLVQFDHYCQLMWYGGTTKAVFHLVYLYRMIFEIALRRDSREREFRADRLAAKLESPHAIVGSLIKVAAYADYRSQVEQKLFEHGGRHNDQLGIAEQIAAGLAPFATSPHFIEAVKSANIPHPFDSHPPLEERMRNVGLRVEEQHYGWIVTRVPNASWVSYIQTAAEIEKKLWAEYEQRFAADHEMSLAYRYQPANDAEREIVLRHFPPVTFELKRDKSVRITYEGLEIPERAELLSWDSVADLKYEDGMGGDVLMIIHPEKGLLGAKKTKVKLPGIRKQRDQFKGTLGQYWNRHRAMREQYPL